MAVGADELYRQIGLHLRIVATAIPVSHLAAVVEVRRIVEPVVIVARMPGLPPQAVALRDEAWRLVAIPVRLANVASGKASIAEVVCHAPEGRVQDMSVAVGTVLMHVKAGLQSASVGRADWMVRDTYSI